MKIDIGTSGTILYFTTLTQVEGGYQVAYGADGSDQKMCPVNQQFCDIASCNGCIHWDNGYKLQHMSKSEVDIFIDEHKDLN